MGFSSKLAGQIQELATLHNLATLIRVAVWLIVGIPAVLLLARYLRGYLSRRYTAQQAMLGSRFVLYLGVGFVVFTVLTELGFKLTTILGAAGIVGVAVGFAAQTSVSNIISGLFIVAERPFEVGDVITVGNVTGEVLSIDALSVKLRTFDNRFVRIPNETILKTEVTNVTRFPIRRVEITVGVAYKEDIGKVRDVLLDIVHRNPLCLNHPEPLVLLSGFGTSSVDLTLMVWATKGDYLHVRNAVIEEIKRRFDQEGIEIPFPHVSLYAGAATSPIPVKLVS
ncbi:MAG: mechanosensitive ion channel family protein [candidate division KSB1 bacterium]|nr:mechanosensitive ion channel family protein [candidate division KSB1 bacterium]